MTATTPQQEEQAARRQHRHLQRMTQRAAAEAERRRRAQAREQQAAVRARLDRVRRELRQVERDYDRCLRSREMAGLERIGNRLHGLIAAEKRLTADVGEGRSDG